MKDMRVFEARFRSNYDTESVNVTVIAPDMSKAVELIYGYYGDGFDDARIFIEAIREIDSKVIIEPGVARVV